MAYHKYTELEVWKVARGFAVHLYRLTEVFPKQEMYGLTSQIRRCAVSVPSNIAKGIGRQHSKSKETIQFLTIARGSLYELETQVYISFDIGFISEVQLNDCLVHIETLGKLLNGFISYLKKKDL